MSLISLALRSVITVALLALLFRGVDGYLLFSRLSAASLPVLGLGTLLQAIIMGVCAQRWQLLLRRQGHVIPFYDIARITWIAAFFGMFLPGTTGNDLVRGRLLHRRAVAVSDLIDSIVIDRLVAFAVLAAMALPLALVAVTGAPEFQRPLVGAALLVGAVGFLLFTSRPFLGRAYKRAGWRWIRTSLHLIVAMVSRCASLLSDTRVLLGTVGLSLLAHLLSIVNVYVLGLSLGLPLGFSSYLLFVPMISLLSMLPISINGLGVREASFVALFGQVGVAQEQALALSLLILITLLVQSAAGGALYLQHSLAETKKALLRQR